MNKYTKNLGLNHGINGKGSQPRTDISAPEYQHGYQATNLGTPPRPEDGFIRGSGKWTKKFK